MKNKLLVIITKKVLSLNFLSLYRLTASNQEEKLKVLVLDSTSVSFYDTYKSLEQKTVALLNQIATRCSSNSNEENKSKFRSNLLENLNLHSKRIDFAANSFALITYKLPVLFNDNLTNDAQKEAKTQSSYLDQGNR